MEDLERGTGAPLPIRSEGGGFAVEGPGFYAWDEDVERVRWAARELRRGRVPRASVRRLLVVEPRAAQDASPPRSDR